MIAEKLLPVDLQKNHANLVAFDAKDLDDLCRMLRSSVYAIWDEGKGIRKDKQWTKTILERKFEMYVKKWQEITNSISKKVC